MSKEQTMKPYSRRAAAIKASGKIKENLDQVSRWEAREKEEMDQKKTAVSNFERGSTQTSTNARYVRKRKGTDGEVATTTKIAHRSVHDCDHNDFYLKFNDLSSVSGRSSSTTFVSSSKIKFDDLTSISSTSSTTFVSSSSFNHNGARDHYFLDNEEQGMMLEMERNEQKRQARKRLRAQARKCHSNRKMHLSRRLSNKIKKESLSPISPIVAVTLNFTPETHLPISTYNRQKETRVAPVTSSYWSNLGQPETTDIYWRGR